MNPSASILTDRAAELRRAFDDSFSTAPQPRVELFERLLLVRAAGQPLAIRMKQIARLEASRPVLSVPSRIPELLGVAAFRGSLAPVYDLGALLGFEGSRAPGRWVALTAGNPTIALNLDQMEGQVDVEPTSLSRSPDTERAFQKIVRTGSVVRVVPDIPALVAALRHRAGIASHR